MEQKRCLLSGLWENYFICRLYEESLHGRPGSEGGLPRLQRQTRNAVIIAQPIFEIPDFSIKRNNQVDIIRSDRGP